MNAGRVLAALIRCGWTIKRQVGSHKVLRKDGHHDYTFAFHDSETIGPVMMSKISKATGLKREDL